MNRPPPSDSNPGHVQARRLAFGFTALVILAIIAMEIWQVWKAHEQEYRRAEVNATNVTSAAAQHARDAVRQADALLVGLIERVEWDGIDKLQVDRMRSLMKRQQRFLPQLHGLFIYDKDGNWLVTDKDSVPAGANNADREYFIHHREQADNDLYIGKAIYSRSTGDLVIPVSRRIDNPDGSFGGVALATLRVSYFVRFYESFDVGDAGIIILALQDGTLLVRRPFLSEAIGASLAKGAVFSELLRKAPAGTAIFHGQVDGVERLFSYRQLADYPLVVETGISTRSITAPWLDQVARSAMVVVAMIVGLVLFAQALIRRIESGALAEEELRLAHDALEQLAMVDGLTGLANRRLDAVLPIEASRARRQGTPLGIVMFDIDHFKRYNDRYGHPAGDQCIKAVAQVVAAFARRPGDLAARYGGEEMTLLLPNSNEADTRAIAEQVCLAVRELGIRHEGSELGLVTLSAGFHAYQPAPNDGTPDSHLLRAADEALYSAKAAGRDRVHPHRAEPAV
ncbi:MULTISPECIES: sensor domain-containing diguanylate cyclase [unclassified Pseudomonas]|uniref:sensor domain-containing diguanylate cyclase n=1 Tax=unclassified Pseudomonas TaxID=196821 RepID=UPI000DAA1430|nr:MULTISPECIES: sensor domain-containing diguanylate cyclase [unclassified Pseudomonas]MDW3712229.1 sensor domain-containing diguanylate cyclase [Pseudomonas sp. 2023EL-01195]PZE09575.1 hypothetical protein DMX10_30445 [Pseudomonas sp. 57B-090624]